LQYEPANAQLIESFYCIAPKCFDTIVSSSGMTQ